ncbi:MAG: hypothetical protein HKO79_12480 [Desulfobacterales bacterium]|nr:hypothetical protein [Desulfobacterales bacterium]
MIPLLGIIAPLAKSLFGGVAEKVCDIVSEKVEDKDLAAQINAQITHAIIQTDITKFVAQINAQKSVLIAEIQGDSWLQRNWRPITMMVFVAIVANNYILFPYLSLFETTAEMTTKLELPKFMWDCIKLGLSGYIVGRSAEKIAAGNGLKGLGGNLMNGNQGK